MVRKLRLIHLPALPLSLSVAIFPASYTLVMGMYYKIQKLSNDSPENRNLSSYDVLSELGSVAMVSFLAFIYWFITVLIFALILNWALKFVGGLRFDVIEDDIRR